MKSKANIKGHSIHPMLVSFPIAFFIGAFISDSAHFITGTLFYAQMGKCLVAAGVISGGLAAVPGIIDYIYTVPPASTANKRAARHGLINTIMISLFLASLLIRQKTQANFTIIIALELAGVILLCIAGWMGGTLVGRNQIGVDHRYAYAGKWKEEVVNASGGAIDLGALDDLKLNQMKLIHAADKRIVVARTESGIAAFDDRCSHRGASLADGTLACGTVQCPWHGSQFAVDTGSVFAGPAKEKIKTYLITRSGEKYYLHL